MKTAQLNGELLETVPSESEPDLTAILEADALAGEALRIDRVLGVDTISQPFRFQIRASRRAGAEVDVESILMKPVSLTLRRRGEELQRLFGTISEVREVTGIEGAVDGLVLMMVPRAHRAALRETLDIFMDESVPQIVQRCLTRSGLAAKDDFDLSELSGTYDPREFTVQYRETDLAVLSRLSEHAGIFYFFDHRGGRDQMVFGDANRTFPELATGARVPYLAEDHDGLSLERVRALEIASSPMPRRYVVRDYNYRMPGVDILVEAEVDKEGVGEIVEYGAHFKDKEDGQRLLAVRVEEVRSRRRVYRGEGTVPSFTAGSWFVLEGHAHGDLELLLIQVEHTFDRAGGYSNRFTAIPRATAYRPPRTTPKPRVSGSLTGIVDAAEAGPYAEIDDQGRYRVRFLYDTAQRGEGQASRPVRMAQPHAGEGYGMHFPLRSGVEVLLTCVDGDPDRPIISGTVPNPGTLSPVTAHNRDRNVIRTGGGNQIDLSDEDGSERIKMTTPHEGTVFQLGAPNEPEVGAILKTSGNAISHAAGLVGTAGTMVTAYSDWKSSFVGKNIAEVAGLPDPIQGWDKFEHFRAAGVKTLTSLIDSADGAAGILKSWKEDSKKKAKREVDELELSLIPKGEKYKETRIAKTVATASGQDVVMLESEEEWQARRADEVLRARARSVGPAGQVSVGAAEAAKVGQELASRRATLKSESGKHEWADWWAENVSPITTPINDGVKAADKLIGVGKSAVGVAKKAKDARDLWSKTHELVAKGGNKVYYALARGSAAFANSTIVKARPRKVSSPRAPGEPYHLSASTDSWIAVGMQSAHLLSLETMVYGTTLAAITSDRRLQLTSAGTAELAAPSVYVTGTTVVDVLSRGTLQAKAEASVSIAADKTMSLTSTGDFSVETEAKLVIRAKARADIDTGDALSVTAKKIDVKASSEHFSVRAAKAVNVTADEKLAAHGAKAAALSNDKGGVSFESSEGRIWHQSTELALKSSTAEMKSKEITLRGTKVNVNGKVFLG